MMEIRLKDILEDAKEATVTLWHVGEGDRVVEGQDLMEIATDKATFDVPSPVTGKVTRISMAEGENFRGDDVVAVIEV